ncbi:MAG: Dihydrofolate synthase/folylpolyglutamate synthase [Pseudomonadota bacterium]|nr:Dihydrofolate synthase/folylpolyglutamate synthase [Pseudomonadota bacterium]
MSQLLDSLVNPQAIQYDNSRLENLKRLAKNLELLNGEIPIISVTGTNGKGSTVAALNRIYREAGYNVGVFTSPHLLSVHERIKVNDTLISEDDLNQLTEILQSSTEFLSLSWFEAFFIISLMHFKRHPLDVLILEVGMGGRLDATNIIDADLVIVTNVDLDHQAYLGETREEIAFEKAGLFRFQKPAIFADEHCPASIREYAQSLMAPLYLNTQDYDFVEMKDHWQLRILEKTYDFSKKPSILLSAMSAAIFATHCLQQVLPVTHKDWKAAIGSVFVPGRFQMVQQAGQALMILDVGHNPHAAKNLLNRLQGLPVRGQVHLIFSILEDKDRKNIVDILKKMDILWYPCLLDCARACDSQALIECLGTVEIHATPALALQKAREQAASNDVIVAFGSFHLIEPLMRLLIEEGCDVFRNH